ncbi:MAG: hypothetical protein GW775_01710 [Candidatus Magasanikbacteria bacterium]|nr:hypothetical protein [bacterium]NCS71967.1 hypothetical protein [Candidatus Magasanikbacteria bacterium]
MSHTQGQKKDEDTESTGILGKITNGFGEIKKTATDTTNFAQEKLRNIIDMY